MVYFRDKSLRNYLLLLSEGVCFMVALVFFDGNTILPLLVQNLTGSTILVGFVGMSHQIGVFLASLFAANLVRTMALKRRFIVGLASIGRLPLWLLAIAMLVLPDHLWVAGAFFVVFMQFLFWTADGLVAVAWLDVVGKSIASHQRGRYFALMQLIAGIVAVFAGGLVRRILALESPGFPGNYGILFLLASGLFSVSIVALLAIFEEPSPTSPREKTLEFILRIPHYFRENPRFAWAMAVSILRSMIALSLPFFVLFAQEELGIPVSDVGLFISAQILGGIIGGLVWGWIGDKFGHHKAIVGVCLVTVLPPVLALATGVFSTGSLTLAAYLVVYFVVGMGINGWPSFTNYVLDVAPPAERAVYTGLMNVVGAPVAFAPVLGGVLIQLTGYYPLFVLTFAITAIGFLLALRLPRG